MILVTHTDVRAESAVSSVRNAVRGAPLYPSRKAMTGSTRDALHRTSAAGA